ncbi:hypothetical protein [Actinomadura flavalba]|uniref:hypothetical protein n=1 Tax=Actinomadura flavalba TaxID=1120938 RepID=UPI0003618834|nr:hypothetical protein [Actinomadura flavalba]
MMRITPALAVLTLALALTACGGGDDGATKAPPSAPGAAPSQPTGTATAGGQRASERFNACMRDKGIVLPTPGATNSARPATEKVEKALRECVVEMSKSPAPAN